MIETNKALIAFAMARKEIDGSTRLGNQAIVERAKHFAEELDKSNLDLTDISSDVMVKLLEVLSSK